MHSLSPGCVIAHELSKYYRHYNSPIERLKSLFSGKIAGIPVHALKPCTFNIQPGEAVAIIGHNGAGKSTLLKLLSGVARHSTGSLQLEGEVVALLELGTGFHGDFSGEENARLQLESRGIPEARIKEALIFIKEFADIGEFIDRPVREYSSGMAMRVAFATAISVKPDILIIDEALSVGDGFFQQKCFRSIKQFIKQGTTVLFVTHDLNSVLSFCNRALVLNKGEMVFDGDARAAIHFYESSQLQTTLPTSGQHGETEITEQSLMHQDINIISAGWYTDDGQQVAEIFSGQRCRLTLRLRSTRDFDQAHFGYKLLDRRGQVVFETNTFCLKKPPMRMNAAEDIQVVFAMDLPLREGDYSCIITMNQGLTEGGDMEQQVMYADGFAPIKILKNRDQPTWDGVCYLAADAELHTL